MSDLDERVSEAEDQARDHENKECRPPDGNPLPFPNSFGSTVDLYSPEHTRVLSVVPLAANVRIDVTFGDGWRLVFETKDMVSQWSYEKGKEELSKK